MKKEGKRDKKKPNVALPRYRMSQGNLVVFKIIFKKLKFELNF